MKKLLQTCAILLAMFSVTLSASAAANLARFILDGVHYEIESASGSAANAYVVAKAVRTSGAVVVIPGEMVIPAADQLFSNDAMTTVTTNAEGIKCAGTTLKVTVIANNFAYSNPAVAAAYNALEEVTIPATINTFYPTSFNNAKNLKKITALGEAPKGNPVFANIPAGCELNVPEGCVAAYTAAWTNFVAKGGVITDGNTTGDPFEPTTVVKVDGINYTLDLEAKTVTLDSAVVSGEITIPATVAFDGVQQPITTIAPKAFASCDITAITLESATPQAITYVAEGTENSFDQDTTCIVTVPAGALAAYETSLWAEQFTVKELEYTAESNTVPYYFTDANGYKFILKEAMLAYNGYAGTEEEITIPTEVTVLQGTPGTAGFVADKHQGWVGKTLAVTKLGWNSMESAETVKKYTVPEGVTVTENFAFGSKSLETLVLPASLEACNIKPFTSNKGYGVTNLKSIEMLGEEPATITDFTGVPETCVMTVPTGTLDAYQAAYPTFPGTIEEKEEITTGVDATTATTVAVYANAGTIVVAGAEAGAAIEVYNATGAQVAATVAQDGYSEIALESGIYIVRVAGVTYKVVC